MKSSRKVIALTTRTVAYCVSVYGIPTQHRHRPDPPPQTCTAPLQGNTQKTHKKTKFYATLKEKSERPVPGKSGILRRRCSPAVQGLRPPSMVSELGQKKIRELGGGKISEDKMSQYKLNLEWRNKCTS